MEELNSLEIEEVSGGLFFASLGYAFGYLFGMGAQSQQYVDSQDNIMLGAMQYGA